MNDSQSGQEYVFIPYHHNKHVLLDFVYKGISMSINLNHHSWKYLYCHSAYTHASVITNKSIEWRRKRFKIKVLCMCVIKHNFSSLQ